MRQAQSRPWFSNTLFVLMGDHGARVYGAAEIPLASYEIPILFYAPGVIPSGQRITTLVSAMDLPPTILARLGISYQSKFFGRDALAMPAAEGRAFMTHNNVIAMMRGEYVAVLGLRGVTTLYRYRKADSGLTRVPAPDSLGTETIRDAIAVFSSADRLYRSGAYRFGDRSPAPLAHPAR
jgi:arylsulfatase A-like enzyme